MSLWCAVLASPVHGATVTLRGVVVDAATQHDPSPKPIPGARVEAIGRSGRATTYTDRRGAFTLRPRVGGNREPLTLRVTHPDSVHRMHALYLSTDFPYYGEDADDLTLPIPGRPVFFGALRGRVIDADVGYGIGGVSVRIERTHLPERGSEGDPLLEGLQTTIALTSDPDGMFVVRFPLPGGGTVEQFPAGSYIVQANLDRKAADYGGNDGLAVVRESGGIYRAKASWRPSERPRPYLIVEKDSTAHLLIELESNVLLCPNTQDPAHQNPATRRVSKESVYRNGGRCPVCGYQINLICPVDSYQNTPAELERNNGLCGACGTPLRPLRCPNGDHPVTPHELEEHGGRCPLHGNVLIAPVACIHCGAKSLPWQYKGGKCPVCGRPQK